MTHTETKNTPLKLFKNLEFVAIASVNFAQGISFATIIIALALYADIFQISGLVAGLFGTAYAVVRLVLVLPLGKYIDVGDSKRYLLIGLLIQVLVLMGYTNVQSFEHVIFLRAIQGGGSIILILTGLSVVGDICPDEQRGLWLGTYSQVTALSSLSGDLVGGFLLFSYGFSTTYVVLALVTLLTAVAVFMFLPSNPGGHTELSSEFGLSALRMLISRKAIQALVMFRFTFSFAKTAIVLFLPIYAHTEFGMSALLIGGILAGGKFTKAVSQGYVGTIADRIGHLHWFVVAGTILYAIGIAAIPLASDADRLFASATFSLWHQPVTLTPSFFVLFLVYSVLGIADSLRLPTSLTMFVEEGQYYRAVASSLSLRSVSWQIGAIFGPLIVGGLVDVTSFTVAFWIAAVITLLSVVLFLLLYSLQPPPET